MINFFISQYTPYSQEKSPHVIPQNAPPLLRTEDNFGSFFAPAEQWIDVEAYLRIEGIEEPVYITDLSCYHVQTELHSVKITVM